MFIKRVVTADTKAEVSKSLIKCGHCGKPILQSMIRLGSSNNMIMCPECTEHELSHNDNIERR